MEKTVFIAMPFNSKFVAVYEEAIFTAFEEEGFRCNKVDDGKLHLDINQEILQGITNADIFFCDLTDLNANVFFEIGYARALDKDIIAATQNPNEVPFDINHHRYIGYENSDSGLKLFKVKLKSAVKAILKKKATEIKINPKAQVHGTKFSVPNSNAFWNKLCTDAQNKFYLLGRTNKSWIDRDEKQQEELASSILRIISNKGKVKIISDNEPETIQQHKDFYKKFLKPSLNKELMAVFKKSFLYGVTAHSNYGSVVSDDRIVILPTMNSKKFAAESLVLELERANSIQLNNYLADIERLLQNREQCQIIDITGNGTKK